MTNFEVELYEKENGTIPVEDFFKTLDKKMQAKFLGLIKILQEYGNELREPYSKHLEDGIFEIRCKIGSEISRVLYFFCYNGKIVLTNGFVKKTQKTPRAEIEQAKLYRKEYLKRYKKNEEV